MTVVVEMVMQVTLQPVVAFVIVLCLIHCQTIDFSNDNKWKTYFCFVIYENFNIKNTFSYDEC